MIHINFFNVVRTNLQLPVAGGAAVHGEGSHPQFVAVPQAPSVHLRRPDAGLRYTAQDHIRGSTHEILCSLTI